VEQHWNIHVFLYRGNRTVPEMSND